MKAMKEEAEIISHKVKYKRLIFVRIPKEPKTDTRTTYSVMLEYRHPDSETPATKYHLYVDGQFNGRPFEWLESELVKPVIVGRLSEITPKKASELV